MKLLQISEGIRPELNYISSVRRDSFKEFEEVYLKYDDMLEKFGNMISHKRMLQAKNDLKNWLSSQLIDDPKMGDLPAEKPYILKMPRVVRWAFISWNKTEQLM